MRTTMFALAVLCAPLSGSAGYRPSLGWPEVTTPVYHAATASQVASREEYWRQRGCYITGLVRTGSMRPVMTGTESLALLPVTVSGAPKIGQCVSFVRGDSPEQHQQTLARLRTTDPIVAEQYRRWLADHEALSAKCAQYGILPPELRTVHYVVDVSADGEWFYLSGTNTEHSDGWVHRSKLRAVVQEIIRPPLTG